MPRADALSSAKTARDAGDRRVAARILSGDDVSPVHGRESYILLPDMFLGHFGVGFGTKRAAPGVSLGALFAACQLADLLWPTLVLVGIERLEIRPGITTVTPLDFVSYPYSHSLVALSIWGLLFGGLYAAIARSRLGPAITLALVVVSHWGLDVLVHRPDMPVTVGGTTRLGFGLWNSMPATLIAELAMFTAGVLVYARQTRARDRIGSVAFGALVAFLLIVYALSVFGPPPPSAAAVAWSAEAMWLLVIWGYWVDRHRTTRSSRGELPRR